MSHYSRVHAGPWSGAVTDTRATIKASIVHDGESVRLNYSPDPDLETDVQSVSSTSLWTDKSKIYPAKIAQFDLEGLTPDTAYHYQLQFERVERAEILKGQFRTFPPEGQQAEFRFAFASCSNSTRGLFSPNGILNTFRAALWGRPEVYDVLHNQESGLRFFCHLGDFHYGDIDAEAFAPRLEHYDTLLQRDTSRTLFRHLPVACTWDDHDFLGNNAAGGDPALHMAAGFARDTYDLYVPHYPLVNRENGIYQAFTFGKILFLLTDTRFNKCPASNDETDRKALLGTAQKTWLKQQFLHGKDHHDLIVWINPIPWIGKPDPESTLWAGYPHEREELAEFLVAHNVRNLCMISGDAHLLAIDDGSHAGYAAGGRGGFPIFHAAALEGMPSEKGGIYSYGDKGGGEGDGIPGTGQYGTVEITYPNGTARPPLVRWKGKRVDHGATAPQTLIQYEFWANQTYPGF
jgi:phosphodiesterase/alkaline phosphatase D-like protein